MLATMSAKENVNTGTTPAPTFMTSNKDLTIYNVTTTQVPDVSSNSYSNYSPFNKIEKFSSLLPCYSTCEGASRWLRFCFQEHGSVACVSREGPNKHPSVTV